jgi:hypothetical protein
VKLNFTCIQCGSSHLGRVRRGKIKCYECNFEWNPRKNSFLESRKISSGEFIAITKFFADGVNASRCADELELGVKQIRHLYSEFRDILFGGNVLNIEDPKKVTFFIRESNGLLELAADQSIDVGTSKAVILATRSKEKDTSYFYRISYKNLSAKKILKQIDRIDNFYRFCQEKILNFRGRDINKLAETLQELVYRYNHRNEDMFSILMNKTTY